MRVIVVCASSQSPRRPPDKKSAVSDTVTCALRRSRANAMLMPSAPSANVASMPPCVMPWMLRWRSATRNAMITPAAIDRREYTGPSCWKYAPPTCSGLKPGGTSATSTATCVAVGFGRTRA